METLLRLCKGYIISAIICIILAITTAALLAFSGMSIVIGGILIYIALAAGTFLFGLKVALTVGGKGILTGLVAGIFFVFSFVFLIGTAFNMSITAMLDNYILIIPIAFSSIGGIIGANLKK